MLHTSPLVLWQSVPTLSASLPTCPSPAQVVEAGASIFKKVQDFSSSLSCVIFFLIMLDLFSS